MGLFHLCSANKGADQLHTYCVLVFTYAEKNFSHDATHIGWVFDNESKMISITTSEESMDTHLNGSNGGIQCFTQK